LFWYMMIVQGRFALVFQTWLYHALVTLTPSITFSIGLLPYIVF
jgi:hypothetical protein